jgi:hypothetical protein
LFRQSALCTGASPLTVLERNASSATGAMNEAAIKRGFEPVHRVFGRIKHEACRRHLANVRDEGNIDETGLGCDVSEVKEVGTQGAFWPLCPEQVVDVVKRMKQGPRAAISAGPCAGCKRTSCVRTYAKRRPSALHRGWRGAEILVG